MKMQRQDGSPFRYDNSAWMALPFVFAITAGALGFGFKILTPSGFPILASIFLLFFSVVVFQVVRKILARRKGSRR